MNNDVAKRLDALLPDLLFSRETHVQWANCSPVSRARNPDIGDRAFHEGCVRDYDERIAAITEAAKLLRDNDTRLSLAEARYRWLREKDNKFKHYVDGVLVREDKIDDATYDAGVDACIADAQEAIAAALQGGVR